LNFKQKKISETVIVVVGGVVVVLKAEITCLDWDQG
jgi:hypothetical protein